MRRVGYLLAVMALAAAPRGRAAAAEPAPPAPAIAEAGPEIFYLQDDAGRLVPVPGFRYRDFVDLMRLREGLPAALEPPAAVLESIVVRADLTRADPAAGTCPVTVECGVRQVRAGWAWLPLGLDGLVLSGPPRTGGPGRAVVDADPAGGYRGWFDAAAGAGDVRHTLALEGTLPVELAADRDTLALRLPAATSTTVELRTNRAAPEVAVLPSASGRTVVARDAEGGSRVSIDGASGAVRIRLAAAGSGDAAWGLVPQASVESEVRIDGRSAIVDAAIRLENLRPGTATIDVSLPPQAVLRAVRPPATIVARGGTPGAPTATIAIELDRAGRAGAELQCELPVDPSGGSAFEPLGFGVAQVESWRQWGRTSLVVEGDWRAEWTDRPGVRRVDPPPAARKPGFVAAFAYDALPASLPVRVRPQVSRVVVEPEYRFEVGATRVALAASLRVTVRGAAATALVLDVDPAFEIDEVGPPSVVDVATVASDAGRLTIPFLQPLAGDAVVEVRGLRRIDRDTSALSWRLPAPRADVVAPARVEVRADSDIEILPDSAASAGLVRQAAAGRDPAAGEPALAYRMDGLRATFAAARRFLARRVDASVEVRARVDEAETEVVETIRLDVSHVPLEYLDFLVTDPVAAAATLEIRQAGVTIDPFAVPPVDDLEPVAQEAGGAAGVVRAVLAEPLLGPGELTVTFRLPTPAVPPETTVATSLPLALPAGVRIERQSIVVDAGDRFAVEVRGDGWRAEDAADEPRTWTATRPRDAVPLAIAARQRGTVDLVVEASWLRTQVLPGRREDVATYVLAGGEGATVTVPASIATATCSVALDGAALPVARDQAGSFAVTLPRAAAGHRRVLEVRTTTTRADGWAAIGERLGLPERLRLEPPTFSADASQRRFFWEILVRPDEHVIGAPGAWTVQQRWRFGRFGLERLPTVESAALADWIGEAAGAAAAAAEPPLLAGRTVFSGLGPPGAAALWLVPTWCAVLVASGAALVIGLAFAYVGVARRPAVVVPLVAAAGLAAAALPDLAPLGVQAALPGAALALLAWVLRAFCDRGPTRTAPHAAAVVSATSRTRAIAAPSVLVSASSVKHEDVVTTHGRSAP